MTYGGTSANPNSTGNYFGYDKVGRVERQRQVTGTTTYTLSYTYNLASRLTSETYPSNRVISYGYEEAGRLSQISEGSTIYANGFAYQPHGGLGSETFGNGMVHSLAYNRRLQPSEVTLKQSAAGVELQRYNYSYGQVNQTDGSVDTTKNNGQIGRIDGFINGAKQWDQRISYDSLGRLSTAGEYRGDTGAQTWQPQYTFDRFGNRFQSGGGNSGLNYVPVVSGDIDANRNRFVSTGATPTTYDPAGNIVTDAKFRNLQYVYDANGRQTAAKLLDNSPLQNSVYDCAGQRVQTIAGGVTRTMVYDIFGQNVADYSNGALERENIYRGGQLFLTWGAMPTPPLNPFTFTDDPLVAGSTVVKAVHLNELRAAVNQARGHAGLSAATWTDDPAQGTVTTIKAVHITELRARLDEARAALGLAAASYTDPTLTVGSTTVKAVHVQELRARTNEALTAPGPAGGTPVLTYLLTDVQGSTRAAMNNNGVGSSTVIARHDFFPFGEEIGSGTGMRTSGQRYGVVNPNRWKYGLTERDNITGLDHTGWRKYENLSGRWTRPDPYKGSMVFSNPQSFNRYTYVQNDPVNFVDPSGLDPASAARRLLGNPSCRALFGNTDPFNLLNSIVRKNRLWVSSIYPRRGYYSNDRSARFLSFARWTRFGTRLAVTIDATYDAPIGQMRNPFIFLSRSFVAEAQRGGDMAHLYGPQSLGIVMVHELLHAAGRIPDDSEGTPGENYQSHLNSLLVKLFCVTLPNQPLSTTTPALNNTPIMRQPIGGGGPGGPTFIGGGGYPGWWYSMWSFLAWVNSIPVGGYGEVIGYDIDDPEKPGHEAH